MNTEFAKMSASLLIDCLQCLIDEMIPGNVPLVFGFHLFRLGHPAVLNRVESQLLEHSKILSSGCQSQKCYVEIVRQWRCAPEGRIIRGNYYRIVIREVNRTHVVPAVVHQFQDLIGDGIQFDADVALLEFLHHPGMLDGTKTVPDALRSQQDGVDLCEIG